MWRLLIALFFSLQTERALAESDVRPALHWTRASNASTCIDPYALALRVTALTGDVLVEPSSATLSIEGHVEPNAHGGFSVRVTSSNRQGVTRGERTLEQANVDCRELDGAIAFVIALLIDPDLAFDRLPPELVALGAEGPRAEEVLLAELEQTPAKPYVVQTVTAPKAQPSVTETLPAQKAIAPTWKRYELSAGAVLAPRELARTSAGAQLALAYVPSRFLSIEGQLRATFMLGDQRLGGGRSVSAGSYGATLLLCPRVAYARLIVDGCVGPELFMAYARGAGFTENRTDTLRGSALQTQLGVGLFIRERLFVRARAWLRYMPGAPRFEYTRIDDQSSAIEAPQLSAGVTFSVGLAF